MIVYFSIISKLAVSEQDVKVIKASQELLKIRGNDDQDNAGLTE